MAYVKTDWENGVTPINATNLNNIETGVETNDISITSLINDFYFKAGDTYSYSGDIYLPSCLTSSKESILFSLPLPKRVENLNVTINSGTIYVRGVSGYLLNGTSITDANSITTYVIGNLLTVALRYPAFSSQTNNTPLSVTIRNLNLSFSAISS